MSNSETGGFVEHHNAALQLWADGQPELAVEEAWAAVSVAECPNYDALAKMGRLIAAAAAMQLDAASTGDDLDATSYRLKLERAEAALDRAVAGGVSVLEPADDVLNAVRKAASNFAEYAERNRQYTVMEQALEAPEQPVGNMSGIAGITYNDLTVVTRATTAPGELLAASLQALGKEQDGRQVSFAATGEHWIDDQRSAAGYRHELWLAQGHGDTSYVVTTTTTSGTTETDHDRLAAGSTALLFASRATAKRLQGASKMGEQALRELLANGTLVAPGELPSLDELRGQSKRRGWFH